MRIFTKECKNGYICRYDFTYMCRCLGYMYACINKYTPCHVPTGDNL
jgi:hypothetical protein